MNNEYTIKHQVLREQLPKNSYSATKVLSLATCPNQLFRRQTDRYARRLDVGQKDRGPLTTDRGNIKPPGLNVRVLRSSPSG